MPDININGYPFISQSGTNVPEINNVKIGASVDTVSNTGAGYKPAEVWLSTTTISSDTTYIDLPAGYSSYGLKGTDLFFNESGDTVGRISLIFQYGSYTDDSGMRGVTKYIRIDAANEGAERYTGRLQLAENMAGEAYDNLNFVGWMHDLTTPNRTRAYSAHFLSEYGHNDATHSYMYDLAGRSETLDVITRLKITMTTNSGSVVAPYGGKVVLTGYTS